MNTLLQNTIEQFIDGFGRLPMLLGWHIVLTVLALVIGISISMPLAIFGARKRLLGTAELSVAGIIQTIPSIAMLALVYAVLSLASLSMQEQPGVGGVPQISLWTAIIALTLYSILPVMRNTVTGIQGVDPALIEAARGVGMTPGQSLRKVELPLAMPVIIAGIRTSTVWIVGIATLSTPVGQSSLGDFIFTGLQLERWGEVLLGCVAAAALAISLDALIAQVQAGAEQRKTWRIWLGAVGLVIVMGYGVGYTLATNVDWSARSRDAGETTTPPRPTITIGAKTFDEQFILASLIRDELRAAGFEAEKQQGLGSTLAFRKLIANEIDAYVDYSGTIWAVQMQRDEVADADTVMREVTDWLKRERGIVNLGPLGFENAYALAMRRDRAVQLGITSVADLTRFDDQLSVGGDYEFFGRPEWQKIVATYGLDFPQQQLRKYQSTLMYQAVSSGEVDVISAFSSDGRIAAYDLLVLDDPKNAIPPYDAILLVSPRASQIEGFLDTLRPLIGSIDDDTMRRANYMVDRTEDKKTPDEAAQWLRDSMAR